MDTGKDIITNTIPLAEQERCYEAYWMREVVRLEKRLKDPVYLQHVHDLGLARLRQGFKTYGDSMYQWPTHRRDAEMDEELADFLVYGSSECE